MRPFAAIVPALLLTTACSSVHGIADDQGIAYYGDPGLLLSAGSPCDFFAEQLDRDLEALDPSDRAHVLGGVIGPVWADAVEGRIVLWRRGHAHERSGTPLVALADLDGPGAGFTFPELDRVETSGLALPDLTGDGLPEIALAEWWSYGDSIIDEEHPARATTLTARDVARGEIVWELDGDAVDRSGWLVGPVRLPDLDDDGLPDLLVTTGRRGSPELTFVALSARDGSRLLDWEHTWTPAAELDRYGVPELHAIEARPGLDGATVLSVVFDLDAHRLLWLDLSTRESSAEAVRELRAEALGFPFVGDVATVGDLDGDGRADLAVAAPPPWRRAPEVPAEVLARLGDDELTARRERGAVVFVGSHDGRELGAMHGLGFGPEGLPKVQTYADVTGDGLPEWLVAGDAFETRDESVTVRLMDPATGAELGVWPSAAADEPALRYLAGPLAIVPDRDGDGLPEVLVSRARGEAHLRAQSVGDCLTSGVLCISSRAFVTPLSGRSNSSEPDVAPQTPSDR